MATVGIFSGPAGATTITLLRGAQLWVKDVNRRGGLNGHQVRYVVYDDGGDPARSKAQYKDAVETQHAIAFLNVVGGLAGSPADYIAAKKIPIIGSDGATPHFYQSPFYFPQHSSVDAMFFSWVAAIAQQVVPQGKTRFGMAYCAEAEIGCGTAARMARKYAASLGLNMVYDAKVSLAQPDYTANCLAARNSGVEVLYLVVDGNSTGRFSASCARQGYRPTYGSGGGLLLASFKDNPNLEGMVSSTNTAPWFQSGTPATDEYQRVAAELGGTNLGQGAGPPSGWVAGKLLEKVAARLPEPPTSEALFQGLWSLHNEDLGGLTYPLTFEEGKPAQPIACWWNIALQKGAWISPDGFQRRCQQFAL